MRRGAACPWFAHGEGLEALRQVLARLERHRPRPEALAALLGRYAALSESRLPVHQWPLE